MSCARVAIVVALLATPAGADEPDVCITDCRIERVRGLLERGEAATARTELLALYEDTKQPELLFAIGQVELQLGNFEAAIIYYERFLATNPSEDQISLAQQAIGAARMRITQPKLTPVERVLPPPPPPRFERTWGAANTVLVVLGGAAILGAGGLLYHAHQLGNDDGGTLAEYDDRLEHAQARRLAGFGIAAAAITPAVGGGGADAVNDDPLDPPVGDCETSYLDYQTFGAPFVTNGCRGCHSSDAPERPRRDQLRRPRHDDAARGSRRAPRDRRDADDATRGRSERRGARAARRVDRLRR